jgi:DNA-binding NtrC family response regulator
MLYAIDRFGARESAGRLLHRSRAPICDDLVLEALQPLDVLQVGCRGEVLDSGDGASAVRSVGSLHEAMNIIAQHEFDAIVLGSKVADAWPTAAYEQIANLAGPTPVVVQADYLGPMKAIKQRHDREQDVIVAEARPSLLARLVLAAILRRRALAEAANEDDTAV